jgi:hypothetical protein
MAKRLSRHLARMLGPLEEIARDNTATPAERIVAVSMISQLLDGRVIKPATVSALLRKQSSRPPAPTTPAHPRPTGKDLVPPEPTPEKPAAPMSPDDALAFVRSQKKGI